VTRVEFDDAVTKARRYLSGQGVGASEFTRICEALVEAAQERDVLERLLIRDRSEAADRKQVSNV
jgi:hypothetical protein